MSKIVGVYVITNKVNGLKYVGQSKDIKRRFSGHRNTNNRKDGDKRKETPLYKDMLKFGLENFSFEILEECHIDSLDDREKYYIEKLDSINNGYNLTSEPHALKDKKVREKGWTDERRKRHKEMLFERNSKNWADKEYRERQTKINRETQLKRLENESYKAEKVSHLKKSWTKKQKKVNQYTLDGKFVRSFESVRSAERETGINIHNHLLHPDKRKQAGGFVFKYSE